MRDKRLLCPECRQQQLEEIGPKTLKCQKCKWVGLSEEVAEGRPDFQTWKRRTLVGNSIVTVSLLVAIYVMDLGGQSAAAQDCSQTLVSALCDLGKAAGPLLAFVGKVASAIIISLSWLGAWVRYNQKKKLESQR